MDRAKIIGVMGWVVAMGCSTPSESGSVAVEGGTSTTTEAGTTTATEGGSTVTPPGDSSSPVFDAGPAGVDDFFAQYGAAICSRLFTCPLPNDDDLGVRNVFGTEGYCNQVAPELLRRGSGLADLFTTVAAGTMHFDAARASACFAALRACGAPLNLTQIASCREMFDGAVPTGGACFVDQDCAGDAYCATPIDAGFQRTCPGSCQPPKAAGSMCTEDAVCAASKGFADCRAVDGGAACLDFTLAAAAAASAPCGLLSPGVFTPCSAGTWCDAGRENTGICRAPLESGAACTSGDDVCAVGLGCVRQDAGYSCVPIQVGRAANAPCGPNTASYCDPFASLECVTGSCALYGDGALGSRCSNRDLGELTCQRGLVCGSSATCGPPGGEGATCKSARDCASGVCGTDLKCAARRCSSH